MPSAIVTDPPNGGNKADRSFAWSIQQITHVISKVIVGNAPGSDTIYAGANQGAGVNCSSGHTHTDGGVYHPGGNTLCYTRPKYKKTLTGTWYTTYSSITSFIST